LYEKADYNAIGERERKKEEEDNHSKEPKVVTRRRKREEELNITTNSVPSVPQTKTNRRGFLNYYHAEARRAQRTREKKEK